MKTDSEFCLIDETSHRVTVRFEGQELNLREGENLAAELLAMGVAPFRRTPVSGAPRNPFCMMGACFDCLVEIDGATRQACMVEVTENMEITMPSVNENSDA